MSPVEAELAYRVAQRAQPDFRFGQEQLVRLLRALRAPPQGAPVAVRHAHLRQIIDEVRALNPRNPMDASFVLQIIASRHAAADMAHMSLDPRLSPRQAAATLRNAEDLLRVARQMERLLKKEQAGRVAPGQAPAEVGFDLSALDAIWCGIDPQAAVPGVDPAGLQSGGHAGAGGHLPAEPAAAERVKYTMCGQRTDLVRLATIPTVGSA